MRVFVYEYMTAVGLGRDPRSPEHGMYLEGRAMRDAVIHDLIRAGAKTVRFHPFRNADHEHSIWRGAEGCDWSLIIAPETGGQLDRDCWAVRYSASRLLGPTPDAVALTTDKLRLAEHWRECGVLTPATTDRDPTPCEAFPVVWKPRDGAGSTDTFLIRDRLELAQAQASHATERPMILQEYVPGAAASCAFLCGPGGYVPLVPAFQLLSADGRFQYEGGELPIPPPLAERAVRLATRAVSCVPGLVGYVGVDLVLGDAADGSRDYAIEINPRLTTSYLGLRRLADFNLAEAMLRAAGGAKLGELRWKPGPVRFSPSGHLD